MLKLKNILLEGISPILFHFTRIPNLVNILKQNKFIAKSAFTTDKEIAVQHGYNFFMSTSRIRNTGFSPIVSLDVCIILDGKKLKTKYKGMPVDYWQKLSYYRKNKEYTQRDYLKAIRELEQEDRILLNSPTIENAMSYIKEINILVSYNDSLHNNKYIKYIIKMCTENSIPLFIYDNKNYFLTNYKSKAINYDNIIPLIKNTDFDIDNYTDEKYLMNKESKLIKACYMLSYGDSQNLNKIKDFFKDNREFLEKLELQFIPKYASNLNFLNLYHDVKYTIIEINIDPSPISRFILKLISQDIRKSKSKSFKEYFQKKFNIDIEY